MNNMFYNIAATSSEMSHGATVHVKHEIVNTTIYGVALQAFKEMCARHDNVVYNAYDLDVPGWTEERHGGRGPVTSRAGEPNMVPFKDAFVAKCIEAQS